MPLAKITLLGIVNYCDNNQIDLFNGLSLPTSNYYSDDDMKSGVLNAIMFQGAEFGVLYTDPYWMQTMIGAWSIGRLPVWQRMLNVLEKEYDPLENYDRKEEWTDAGSSTASRTGKDSGSTNNMGTLSNDVSGSPDSTESVSAYNQTSFTPNKKVENTLDQHTEETARNIGYIENNQEETENQNTHNMRSGRAHGNIGVTTSQEMLRQEMEISRVSSIFEIIAEDFVSEFCLMIY